MTEKQQGQKHDDGKPRLDYLDPYAMEEVAKVLTFGAAKLYAGGKERPRIRVVPSGPRYVLPDVPDLDGET